MRIGQSSIWIKHGQDLIKVRPDFVLAWITSTAEDDMTMQDGGHVVFVKHPERGWEIPGGHLKTNESPEDALIREVMEETGLEIRLKTWNKEYYSSGWVAHVTTDSIPCPDHWVTEDDKVEEVGWWSIVPPVVTWTKQEFVDIDEWVSNIK